MEMSFPFAKKRFIGIRMQDLEMKGYNPSKVIVPAWFGFHSQVEQVPEHCEIEVTGRSQFKLFINGTGILFGPCRSNKEVAYYDTIDIAPYLVAGENRVILQVLSYPEHPDDAINEGPNYCYGDNGGPAVSVEGRIGDTDSGQPENWYAWVDESMHFNADGIFLVGSMEVVDGACLAGNPLFAACWDTEKLLRPVVVQDITYDLYGGRRGKIFMPRPIPLLYRKEKTFPDWREQVIAPGQEVRFVLDAKELTTAYFRIGFEGGRGAKVRMMYAESYYHKDENGKVYKGVRDDTSGYIDGVYDTFTVYGDSVYEPFRFRTFRFIEIRVKTQDEALKIVPQPYVETAYPLKNTKRPSFTDPAKEKLYDVAFRTLQLCAHDTYEDCPYYEQLQYACDTRLEILFTYASTDDTMLPARAIDLFASSLQNNGFTQSRFPSRLEQIIPSFALHFVLMLEDYVQATGDYEYIRKYIPTAERIVETFLSKRCEDGLLAPQGYWDFFDWTKEWSEPSTPTAAIDGESALQNLFFVYAVQSLVRLLPKYGRSDLAGEYEKECGRILALVEKLCFVPQRGLYKEGPATEEYTQHTQIYAVLTGLVKGEQAKALMEKVLTDTTLVQCSFVQKYYLFRALEKVGMYDRTEELWKDWQEFIDLHCTTFPETPFDPRSDCHAWSALPLLEFAENQ